MKFKKKYFPVGNYMQLKGASSIPIMNTYGKGYDTLEEAGEFFEKLESEGLEGWRAGNNTDHHIQFYLVLDEITGDKSTTWLSFSKPYQVVELLVQNDEA